MKSIRKMMLVAAVLFCCQPPETKTMDMSGPEVPQVAEIQDVTLDISAPSAGLVQDAGMPTMEMMPTAQTPAELDVVATQFVPAGLDDEMQDISAQEAMPMLEDQPQIDDEEGLVPSLALEEQEVIAPMPMNEAADSMMPEASEL